MSSLLELKQVVHALDPIADKYFEVGVQLGLKPELLRRIEGEHPSYSRRLHETIHSWQRNNPSERCTWFTLADAVARVKGYDNLVCELRKRGSNAPVSRQPCGEFEDSAKDTGYSTKSDWTTSSGSETATEKPCSVAKIEGQDDLDHVDQRGNNLPPLPSESGAEDTGYSTKSDSPISDTESSSGSDIERFELMPGCGCGKKKPCSLPMLCTRGCPNPTSKRIAVLQKKRVGAVTQDELPLENENDCEEYERETKQIKEQFGDLVTDTCCSFKEQKVDIEMLTLYLQTRFPVLEPRLNKATSMQQVFKIVVGQVCSWFDYEVIVSIIKKFGESSDKRRAQMYEEEFRKYAKQRLPKRKKHIEIGSGAKVGTKQLVVKIDKVWEEVNFNELNTIRDNIANIISEEGAKVRRSDLYLADVREGCIMMTFMIQKELANKLFPTKSCLTAEQIHSLKSESVIFVKCGKFNLRISTNEISEERNDTGMVETKTKMSCQPQPAKVHSENVWKRKLLKVGLIFLMGIILFGTVVAGVYLFGQSVNTPASLPHSTNIIEKDIDLLDVNTPASFSHLEEPLRCPRFNNISFTLIIGRNTSALFRHLRLIFDNTTFIGRNTSALLRHSRLIFDNTTFTRRVNVSVTLDTPTSFLNSSLVFRPYFTNTFATLETFDIICVSKFGLTDVEESKTVYRNHTLSQTTKTCEYMSKCFRSPYSQENITLLNPLHLELEISLYYPQSRNKRSLLPPSAFIRKKKTQNRFEF